MHVYLYLVIVISAVRYTSVENKRLHTYLKKILELIYEVINKVQNIEFLFILQSNESKFFYEVLSLLYFFKMKHNILTMYCL